VEDTEEMKDEDVEGTRDEDSKDEDLGRIEDSTEKVTGFDKDEYFIKGDGFKDNSEDTADEEMMKQDEAQKNQEVSKKELASAADITDAPETETEIQEGVLEDTVRTESQRKSNSQHSKNWWLKELMLMLRGDGEGQPEARAGESVSEESGMQAHRCRV
jgi:hypothetical protein